MDKSPNGSQDFTWSAVTRSYSPCRPLPSQSTPKNEPEGSSSPSPPPYWGQPDFHSSSAQWPMFDDDSTSESDYSQLTFDFKSIKKSEDDSSNWTLPKKLDSRGDENVSCPTGPGRSNTRPDHLSSRVQSDVASRPVPSGAHHSTARQPDSNANNADVQNPFLPSTSRANPAGQDAARPQGNIPPASSLTGIYFDMYKSFERYMDTEPPSESSHLGSASDVRPPRGVLTGRYLDMYRSSVSYMDNQSSSDTPDNQQAPRSRPLSNEDTEEDHQPHSPKSDDESSEQNRRANQQVPPGPIRSLVSVASSWTLRSMPFSDPDSGYIESSSDDERFEEQPLQVPDCALGLFMFPNAPYPGNQIFVAYGFGRQDENPGSRQNDQQLAAQQKGPFAQNHGEPAAQNFGVPTTQNHANPVAPNYGVPVAMEPNPSVADGDRPDIPDDVGRCEMDISLQSSSRDLNVPKASNDSLSVASSYLTDESFIAFLGEHNNLGSATASASSLLREYSSLTTSESILGTVSGNADFCDVSLMGPSISGCESNLNMSTMKLGSISESPSLISDETTHNLSESENTHQIPFFEPAIVRNRSDATSSFSVPRPFDLTTTSASSAAGDLTSGSSGESVFFSSGQEGSGDIGNSKKMQSAAKLSTSESAKNLPDETLKTNVSLQLLKTGTSTLMKTDEDADDEDPEESGHRARRRRRRICRMNRKLRMERSERRSDREWLKWINSYIVEPCNKITSVKRKRSPSPASTEAKKARNGSPVTFQTQSRKREPTDDCDGVPQLKISRTTFWHTGDDLTSVSPRATENCNIPSASTLGSASGDGLCWTTPGELEPDDDVLTGPPRECDSDDVSASVSQSRSFQGDETAFKSKLETRGVVRQLYL